MSNSLWSVALASTLILLTFTNVTTAAEPAVLRVPEDYATIQSAVDAAVDGDSVLVAPGTYTENVDFGGKQLTLASTGGPEVTTIVAQPLPSPGAAAVTMGPGAVLEGFTVTGATTHVFGGAVESTGSAFIRRNIFEGNSSPAGGEGAAIFARDGGVIERNLFRNNACADEQFNAGVVTLFGSNRGGDLRNNVFHDNDCRAVNLAFFSDRAAAEVRGNTIVRNRVGVRVHRAFDAENQLIIGNVLAENGIGLEVDFGTEALNPTFEHNLLHDNALDYDVISNQTGVNGNISADPLFVDGAVGDFHLLSSSPAIEAGQNEVNFTTDFDGATRPADADFDGIAIADIGAFEFPEPPSLTVEIDIPGSFINTDSSGLLPVTLNGSPSLDVLDVDAASLRFGKCGSSTAALAHDLTTPAEITRHYKDVDRDGDLDLKMHYVIADASLAGAQQTCLIGQMVDGTLIKGIADVVTFSN